MKLQRKIVGGVMAVVVVIVLSQIGATRYGYFDVNNGQRKIEWGIFGHVFWQTIEDTDYSKLLVNVGFKNTSPDWKLAKKDELSLWRLFFPEYLDFRMGSIEADSYIFAGTMEFNKQDEAKRREMIEHFRSLVQKGDSSEVQQYVRFISQGEYQDGTR